MKGKKNLWAFLLIISCSLQAQPYYFSQDTATYVELSGGASVNGTSIWSGFQSFSVPIGFSFPFMDSTFTQFDFEATGRLIFDGGHYYFADPCVINGFRDRGFGTGTSQSPITYHLTGTVGNRILKLQVKNAGFTNNAAYYVNYQVWLYEADHSIELHMGDNSAATLPNNPLSGVFAVQNWSPLSYVYALSLTGTAASPMDTTYTANLNFSINALPASGTVYRYSLTPPPVTALSPVTAADSEFKIYPNPVQDILYLESPENTEIQQIAVYNHLGQELMKLPFTNEIDLSSLSQGLYRLVLLNNQGIIHQQPIIKN